MNKRQFWYFIFLIIIVFLLAIIFCLDVVHPNMPNIQRQDEKMGLAFAGPFLLIFLYISVILFIGTFNKNERINNGI
ncbi:hypothetical protein KJ684_03455 [Patescibacteria group bacterium]|nr:hypothetical protein [Patescibacteria group bacterium]